MYKIIKGFCLNVLGLIFTILFILFLIYGFSMFSVAFDIMYVGLNDSRIIGGSEDERILIQNSLDKMPWYVNYRILSIRVVNSQSEINEICQDEFYGDFDAECPDCYIAGCAETWTSFAPSRIYLLSLNDYPITEHTIYHEIGHVAKGTSELKADQFAEQFLNK